MAISLTDQEAETALFGLVKTIGESFDHAAAGTQEILLRVETLSDVVPREQRPWVKLYLRHTAGGQRTLGPQPVHDQRGVLNLDIYVPFKQAALLNPLADLYKDGLRVAVLEGIQLRHVRRTGGGPDLRGGPWQMATVLATFDYDQI